MPRGISRFDEAAFQERLWTPQGADFAIAAWFDASDIQTLTHSGSGISDWKDKSINAVNATQATTTSQPIFVPNVVNGLAGLDWSGDLMSTNLSASSSAESIFMIIRLTSGFGQLLTADANGGRLFRVDSPNYLAFLRQGQASLATSNPDTIPTGKVILIGMTYNSTETKFYLSGKQIGSTVTVNPALTAGRTSTISGGNWPGGIHEILVVQSVVVEPIREKIEGYLAWKWALNGDLAGSHRFATRPPTIGD